MDRPTPARRASSVHLDGSFFLLARCLLWLAPFDVALATMCAVVASHIAESAVDEHMDISAATLAERDMQWLVWFIIIMMVFIQVYSVSGGTLVTMGNKKSIKGLPAESVRFCRILILGAVSFQTLTFLYIGRNVYCIFFTGMARFLHLEPWGNQIVAGYAIFGMLSLAFCCMGSYVGLYGH